MTPFSPKEITIFSNVEIKEPKLFDQPLQPLEHFRYSIADGRGFSFYDLQALDRSGKSKKIRITGTYGNQPFKKCASYRRTRLNLKIDHMRTDLIADGSELVTVIATLADRNGTPKHLADERICFSVDDPAEIVETEEPSLNPQQTRYGEAVILLRMGTTPGKVTVRAAVDRSGRNVSGSAVLSFTTIPSPIPLIYDTPAPLAPCRPLCKEKQAKPIDLREVEKQQTAFGE